MYESHSQSPISRQHFIRRLLLHTGFAFVILLLSIAMGMAGYMDFEQLPWRDAFLNTAMLLGGMGPVNAPLTGAGKLFAGVFALYAGLVFVIMIGLMLTPIAHRMLHKFHWGSQN